jgi:hypothetical protein
MAMGMAFAVALLAAPTRAAAPGHERHSPPPTLAETLGREAPALRPPVLELALSARENATRAGLVPHPELLTVIDYSLPSTEPRLWVFDLEARKLLFHEMVAHGRMSGENWTNRFSNRPGSRQTSLGLFVTADTYVGQNGYSLRLAGLEAGINDRALERAIVIHGAPYVSTATVAELGRLGRSFGCPAVSKAVVRALIDTIKGGSAVFAYYPEWNWLARSVFLQNRTAAVP